MTKKKLFFYSVASGLLLIPGWFEWGHGLSLLIAFIPLLFIENYFDINRHLYKSVNAFFYAALSFFLWNVATTWWIMNATFVGMIFAVIINTFLQALVFWLFHIVKRRLGQRIGYFSLIVFWVYFEYFYFNAEISWPWLTLGYGFMFKTRFVQWYDTTGILGGSVWILLSNILIYKTILLFNKKVSKRSTIGSTIITIMVIVLPVIISHVKYYTYKEKQDPYEMVVLQPNIDPYTKFISDTYIQTLKQIELCNEYVDSTTEYVVGPETSLNNSIWLENIGSVPDVKLIAKLTEKYPRLKYVVGAQCYVHVYGEDTADVRAREFSNSGIFYKSYNAAIQIDTSDNIPAYFKSQLVVGVEKMPYAKFFRIFEKWIIELGGTTRGWSTQEERDVFVSPQDSVKIAPVICWESVFGEYVTDYIKLGANFIFVITNDGWWGDTPGYRQHNGISRIRAIETRRSIARSANTGISAFMDQRGDVVQSLGWWKEGALKASINANDKMTFYVIHGDYLGRISGFFSLIVVGYFLVRILMRRD